MLNHDALRFLATLHNYNSKRFSQTPEMIPHPAQESHASPNQQALRKFLDYLAQVCHSRKDGRAVTAIAVRDDNGKACYVVATTGRSDWVKKFPADKDLKLKELENFLQILLEMFSHSERGIGRPVETQALSHIVGFNHRRLKSYVQSLSEDMKSLTDLNRESFDKAEANAEMIRKDLTKICGNRLDGKGSILRHRKYKASGALTLCPHVRIQANYAVVRDEMIALIRNFAAERMTETDQLLVRLDEIVAQGKVAAEDRGTHIQPSIYMIYHNIQHGIRCITSYHKAVEFFAKIALLWPALFNRFSIKLPKFKPGQKHIGGKSEDPDELIGRLFSFHDQKFISQEIGNKFPKFRAALHKQSGNLCLHSEVFLWRHIRSRGKGFVQFNQVQDYAVLESEKIIIGVSKPTCLLCSWYFEELSSQVLIRSTSHNVYVRWEAPPPERGQKDDFIMEIITEKLKQTAKAVIQRGWAYRLDQDSAGGTPPADRQTFSVHDGWENLEQSDPDSVSIVTPESVSAVSERTAVTGFSGLDTADESPRMTYAQVVASGLHPKGAAAALRIR